jgi:hypothetical protein
VGPITGLDDVEKRTFLTLPGLELGPLSHPVCRQSLYRLRYPAPQLRTFQTFLSVELLCEGVDSPASKQGSVTAMNNYQHLRKGYAVLRHVMSTSF